MPRWRGRSARTLPPVPRLRRRTKTFHTTGAVWESPNHSLCATATTCAGGCRGCGVRRVHSSASSARRRGDHTAPVGSRARGMPRARTIDTSRTSPHERGTEPGGRMAVEETEFTQVFRGYDKDEVDKSLNGLRRDIINANNQLAEQSKESKRLLARIEELTAELEEGGSPTFSGLGTKLENTLRVAEEQSTRLIAQADIDAEKLRRAAEDEAHLMRSDAHELAERTLTEARAQANRVLENARAEVDDMVSPAQRASEQLGQGAPP